MAIFGPKPWKNVNFSTFLTSFFYSLERRFSTLEYRKRHFSGLYCLKKKVGKMAIFGPKPWLNPFGKMSIFRLFGLLVFIAQKGVFSLQNIVKDLFLAYIAPKKKKNGKMAIFGPKPWVNPLEKCDFFHFLHFLFLQPAKAFFHSRIS